MTNLQMRYKLPPLQTYKKFLLTCTILYTGSTLVRLIYSYRYILFLYIQSLPKCVVTGKIQVPPQMT